MGPRHRALFPNRRRYALVALLEDAGVQAGLVGDGRAAHSYLRRLVLFFYASG